MADRRQSVGDGGGHGRAWIAGALGLVLISVVCAALVLPLLPGATNPAAPRRTSRAGDASAPRRTLAAVDASANWRPRFQMPFPCGATRQGATYEHHGGPGNHFPLDFNRGSGNDDEGDPVVASAAGTVHRYIRADGAKIVVIRHNARWTTDYRHLSAFSVSDGAQVKRGDQIGLVGRTGTGNTAHLHYEQQKNGRAVAIRFDGLLLDPGYSFTYNGPTYVSRNC